ncbi:MAG TPA: hypothetical protein VH186_09665 [Chloroflexia bacterium]|nr:hypothetical protein [Chloroflexia bacterium]
MRPDGGYGCPYSCSSCPAPALSALFPTRFGKVLPEHVELHLPFRPDLGQDYPKLDITVAGMVDRMQPSQGCMAGQFGNVRGGYRQRQDDCRVGVVETLWQGR